MPEDNASSHLGLYRAGLTGPEHRRYISVGRDVVFEDAIEILRLNKGKKPKHHQLFVGTRGIGKTHLLSLIEDEINRDPELSAAYRVVRFPEESHRTLSFADFLLGVCEVLRDTTTDEPVWQQLHDRLSTEENDSIIVDTLVPAIRQHRRDSGQALLVMLENLNQIFEEQIKSSRSIAAMRGFFMEDNGCLLIATAPLHFDAISDPKQPFYDFFDVQILDQLTDEQTIELIRRNLEWEKRDKILAGFPEMRPKLLALYRMTGGSPRLTLMLYELIAHETVTEIKKQFHLLLDRITPFYQDRMNDLGPQERALLETMAVMRGQPKTPAAIAERMRMKPQQVSTLLGRLTRAQYLKSNQHPDDKRSRLYSIREGFFDIWLAMNVSRGERVRLPFLLDFFAEFYPTLEAHNRNRAALREYLNKGKPDSSGFKLNDAVESLDYLSEVGSESERAGEKLRLAAVYNQRGDLEAVRRYATKAKLLPLETMGGWIIDRIGGPTAPDYLADLEQMIECWEANRTGELEAFAEKIREMGEGLSLETWSEAKIEFLQEHLEVAPLGKDRVITRLNLARLLSSLGRWADAEPLARETLREAESLGDPKLISWALSLLAQLLHETECDEQAEPLLERALEIDEAVFGNDHPILAVSLNDMALLLGATNRHEQAEQLIERAVKIILNFSAVTGHRLPRLETILINYRILARERQTLDDTISERLIELGAAAGIDRAGMEALLAELFADVDA